MSNPSDTATVEHAAAEVRASALERTRAWLLIELDGVLSSVALSPGRPLVVGRSAPSDVIIADPGVSRQHARLELVSGSVQVVDLDSKNGEAVMELLRELHREGATICMVTHDPRYARHADRSIHLFDGRVVEEDGSKRAEKELEESGFHIEH